MSYSLAIIINNLTWIPHKNFIFRLYPITSKIEGVPSSLHLIPSNTHGLDSYLRVANTFPLLTATLRVEVGIFGTEDRSSRSAPSSLKKYMVIDYLESPPKSRILVSNGTATWLKFFLIFSQRGISSQYSGFAKLSVSIEFRLLYPSCPQKVKALVELSTQLAERIRAWFKLGSSLHLSYGIKYCSTTFKGSTIFPPIARSLD